MSGFEYALQQTIYNRLAVPYPAQSLSLDFGNQVYLAREGAGYDEYVADFDALHNIITGVYDNTPQEIDAGASSDFPYITIGDDTHNDWSTDTSLGDDATITIHCWSRYRGRAEVKEIQGYVYGILARAELSVSGFHFVTCEFLDSQSFVDTDGLTRHGVQTFRVILDESET